MNENDLAYDYSIFEEDVEGHDLHSDQFKKRMELDGKFIANKIREYMKEVSQKEVDYQKMFNDLYLSVYDVQKAYHVSTDNFTQSLLNQGIRVNPEDLYSEVERILTRLTTVSIVKDLCGHLGLIHEYDLILEKEMNLVYRQNGPVKKEKSPLPFSFQNQTPGDVNNGERK